MACPTLPPDQGRDPERQPCQTRDGVQGGGDACAGRENQGWLASSCGGFRCGCLNGMSVVMLPVVNGSSSVERTKFGGIESVRGLVKVEESVQMSSLGQLKMPPDPENWANEVTSLPLYLTRTCFLKGLP